MKEMLQEKDKQIATSAKTTIVYDSRSLPGFIWSQT